MALGAAGNTLTGENLEGHDTPADRRPVEVLGRILVLHCGDLGLRAVVTLVYLGVRPCCPGVAAVAALDQVDDIITMSFTNLLSAHNYYVFYQSAICADIPICYL